MAHRANHRRRHQCVVDSLHPVFHRPARLGRATVIVYSDVAVELAIMEAEMICPECGAKMELQCDGTWLCPVCETWFWEL